MAGRVWCDMLCLVLAAAGSLAASPQPEEDSAALHYRKALALLPKPSKDEQTILESFRTAPLNHGAVHLLQRGEAALQEWKRGTARTRCDWGRDWRKVDTLFPDLRPQSDLANLVCLHARRSYEAGRGQEATEDLLALIVTARQLGQNGPAMELVLQYAIEGRAIDVLGAYLPDQSVKVVRDLSAHLDHLPRSSTLHESMDQERQFLVGWYRRRFEKVTFEKACEVLRESNSEAEVQAILKAAGGKVAGILGLIDEAAPNYDDWGKILMLPADQYPAAVAAFKQKHEIRNPILTSIVSTGEPLRRATLRMQTRFVMLRAAIAMTLEGPERRKAFKDPYADGPFLCEAFPGGFELRSSATTEGLPPLILTVGRKKAS